MKKRTFDVWPEEGYGTQEYAIDDPNSWVWTGLGCDVCGFGTVENTEEFDSKKPCPECGSVMGEGKMKITLKHLRSIIKEELERMTETPLRGPRRAPYKRRPIGMLHPNIYADLDVFADVAWSLRGGTFTDDDVEKLIDNGQSSDVANVLVSHYGLTRDDAPSKNAARRAAFEKYVSVYKKFKVDREKRRSMGRDK